MISFLISKLEGNNSIAGKLISEKTYEYPDILKIACEFKILINDRVFFEEPHFPVFEFLKYADKWAEYPYDSNEMSYSSIETECNPLISFIKKNEKWFVFSPWQKFECTIGFEKEEILHAVLFLKKILNNLEK